jgi:hypothetical protein
MSLWKKLQKSFVSPPAKESKTEESKSDAPQTASVRGFSCFGLIHELFSLGQTTAKQARYMRKLRDFSLLIE